MNKSDIVKIINGNPRFFLGTIENGFPKVRGMLAYEISEKGILFHTSKLKDIYKQLLNNSNCELCFICENGTQIRLMGNAEEVNNSKLMTEIFNHPSREFLREWKDEGSISNLDEEIAIFNFHYDKALVWNMDTNFESKRYINMV